jgi:hypothetical protein
MFMFMNSVLVTLSMSRWIRDVIIVVPAARAALFPKTKSKHIDIYIYYDTPFSGRRSALLLSRVLSL